MAISAFDLKEEPPTDPALVACLGRSAGAWQKLKERLEEQYGPLAAQWNFAGRAYGWSLRLKQTQQKKRAVVYMTPRQGDFLASFALGEKACAAAHEARLPPDVLDIIDSAPKYVEGRAVRIPVRRLKDVTAVCEVAACKMST